MDFEPKEISENPLNTELRFLLLGSINNIFDMEKCLNLFKGLSTNATSTIVLEIIGLGESLEILMTRLKAEAPSVVVVNHGAIFDRKQKDAILSRMHFGLNLYKNTTAIGVSYKSIEYMAHGIPLINSAQGDLFDLINESSMGFNIIDNLDHGIDKLKNLDNSQYQSMRKAAFTMYQKSFSKESFEKNLLSYLEQTS